MNFNWNIETYISVASTVVSIIGSIIIIKINWWQKQGHIIKHNL